MLCVRCFLFNLQNVSQHGCCSFSCFQMRHGFVSLVIQLFKCLSHHHDWLLAPEFILFSALLCWPGDLPAPANSTVQGYLLGRSLVGGFLRVIFTPGFHFLNTLSPINSVITLLLSQLSIKYFVKFLNSLRFTRNRKNSIGLLEPPHP